MRIGAVPRCGCGEENVIVEFETRLWCRTCALFAIGDDPARTYFALIGEAMPAPGHLIGRRPVRTQVSA